MRFCLGVTDNEWYDYLSAINPEDINFWQPGGSQNFKALESGEPFLFKLKHPRNVIGGVGFFSSHSFLPISIAWDFFGERNGCNSYKAFREKILGLRTDKQNSNPTIGCIVLTNPVFFKPSDWIPAPADWSNNIVVRKSYDDTNVLTEKIWANVERVLMKYGFGEGNGNAGSVVATPQSYYGNPILTKVRIGQGAFRVLITDAYKRRCSISGEKTLPVLEAAHIQSYSELGPQKISNGILLRADIHKLFDTGYLTITKDYNVEVSGRIKEEFENGREYYKYHGHPLQFLPSREYDKPAGLYIDWHNTNIFKG